MSNNIIIIGAGLAGLSAALKCAKKGINVFLVSSAASERAQSVMAEGGINASLNTKGENDSVEQHTEDTMKAGCYLADEEAVRGMCEAAPDIVRELLALGVQFNLDEKGKPDLRNFGGQKKKRTAFAKSDTGKQIMTALIDEVRKYEISGVIKRLAHHSFITLIFTDSSKKSCLGCVIRDEFSGNEIHLQGAAVIIATGGMHGLFGNTTGSKLNTGEVTAELFRLGVELVNPEFIQYHPTTAHIGGIIRGRTPSSDFEAFVYGQKCSGKRMLLSEAARGEGGRLFALKGNERWYFMEEKYPELGNLMPRDITSREIWNVRKHYPVFLDMSRLPAEVIENKLAGLVDDCVTYLRLDPRKEPVPVEPGIHYFMGGIRTDIYHRTNIKGLYAAGECCGMYHGANRLGGNSLLGAIYGGRVAAENASDYIMSLSEEIKITSLEDQQVTFVYNEMKNSDLQLLQVTLLNCMGVVRSEEELIKGLEVIKGINGSLARLGEAFVLAALNRKESRGAHFRSDYPNTSDEFCKSSIFRYEL